MSDFEITRLDAIRIFDGATDKDDPFWENWVADWYDEDEDELPSVYHFFEALGVMKEEYMEATGADNVNWPEPPPIGINQNALFAEEVRTLKELDRARENLVRVPVVDDYYPEVSHRYSGAFTKFMDAVCKRHFGTTWAKVCQVMRANES
tara:strand:+ start:203 stop:652 length:450 start_codon:yes stop_codon:yes gene_type:complete